MTERWYRLIQGAYLLVALYIESDLMFYGLMGILSFEALTDLRLPIIISRLRIGSSVGSVDNGLIWAPFSLHPERLLKIVVVLFLFLSCVIFPESIWYFPWFVAAMLLLAGITNICPMVMMFEYLGIK